MIQYLPFAKNVFRPKKYAVPCDTDESITLEGDASASVIIGEMSVRKGSARMNINEKAINLLRIFIV